MDELKIQLESKQDLTVLRKVLQKYLADQPEYANYDSNLVNINL